MEAVFRKKLPGYQPSVPLLQHLSFKQAVLTNLPNVSVELSGKEGVLFIGAADDLVKAEQLLAEFLSNVQTSDSQWKLDRYKVKLLYAKETRQFLMDEFVRQDIECHFTFDENTELVKLFAQSINVIGRAESVLEKCICVMKVSQNYPFISSARNMSLRYSGKCMLIDEKEEKVFVFTCDIEDAVNMSRQKELEPGSEELDTEEIIEVTCAEYKSSVQLLKCLSFAEILASKLQNMDLILDLESGVILKGVRAEVNKANSILTHFVEEVKTSGPEWKLDIHKAQLLKVKVVQNNLQEKMHRQGLKCYMAFQEKEESLKVYALSEADIQKAHDLIDESICVMEVPLNDRFHVSEASDLCLEFAGSIIQITKHDKVVFVFTSDIETDVKAASDRAYSPGDELKIADTNSDVKSMCASDDDTSSDVDDYGHAKLKAKCSIDTKPSTAGYIGHKNISCFEIAKNEYGANTSDANHYSKTKLSEITHDSNRLGDGISSKLAPRNINIKMNYSPEEFGKKHGNSVFDYPKREPDQGIFYIRDVEQRIYLLLQLDLKEHGKALDRNIKYNHTSSELCVNGDRDTYLFISERINTLKLYASDSVETTCVKQRDLISKAVGGVKRGFPKIIVDERDSEIQIHGPSEEIQQAKHKLKVLLALVKTTGRAGRSVVNETPGAYSSLKPSFSDKTVPVADFRSSYRTMTETSRLYKDDHHESTPSRKRSEEPVTFSTAEKLIIQVYKGSITDLKVDCIVNAANESLAHAGGVAYVIARAAGRQFEKECEEYVNKNGKLKVTGCVVTGAGNMRYANIIHAVGPRWNSDDKRRCRDDLSLTVANCLKEADGLMVKSVAIPLISAGIFGMPKEDCADQYCRAVYEFSSTKWKGLLKEVHFVDLQDDIVQTIRKVFSNMFVVLDTIENRQGEGIYSNSNRPNTDQSSSRIFGKGEFGETGGRAKQLDQEPQKADVHEFRSGKGNTMHSDRSPTRIDTQSKQSKSDDYNNLSNVLHKGSLDYVRTESVSQTQAVKNLPVEVRKSSAGQSVHRSSSPPLATQNIITKEEQSYLQIHQERRLPNEDAADRQGKSKSSSSSSQDQVKSSPSQVKPKSSSFGSSTRRLYDTTPQTPVAETKILAMSQHRDQNHPYEFYPMSNERVHLLVYRQDISMLSLDAVVSLEDISYKGEGSIAQAIQKVCGPEFASEHAKVGKAKLKLSQSLLTKSSRAAPFKYVMHAFAPRWIDQLTSKNPKEFADLIKKTVKSILHKIRDQKDIASIGIPLLGIGDNSTDVHKCCKFFVDGLMECCKQVSQFPPNLKEIHLVASDDVAVYLLKEYITAVLDDKPEDVAATGWKQMKGKGGNKNRNTGRNKHGHMA